MLRLFHRLFARPSGLGLFLDRSRLGLSSRTLGLRIPPFFEGPQWVKLGDFHRGVGQSEVRAVETFVVDQHLRWLVLENLTVLVLLVPHVLRRVVQTVVPRVGQQLINLVVDLVLFLELANVVQQLGGPSQVLFIEVRRVELVHDDEQEVEEEVFDFLGVFGNADVLLPQLLDQVDVEFQGLVVVLLGKLGVHQVERRNELFGGVFLSGQTLHKPLVIGVLGAVLLLEGDLVHVEEKAEVVLALGVGRLLRRVGHLQHLVEQQVEVGGLHSLAAEVVHRQVLEKSRR